MSETLWGNVSESLTWVDAVKRLTLSSKMRDIYSALQNCEYFLHFFHILSQHYLKSFVSFQQSLHVKLMSVACICIQLLQLILLGFFFWCMPSPALHI